MKKIILFITLLSAFFISAQNIKTDKFEVFLNDYTTSEVNISKGMYMTKNAQYFYEGNIEINYIDSNTSKMVQFYFSIWDKEYKEFVVKDLDYKIISPRFSYADNKKLNYTNASGEVITSALQDNSNIEYTILSSILVWLNSGTKVEKEKITNNTTEIINKVKEIVKPKEEIKLTEKIATSKGKLIENKDAKLTEGKKELEKNKSTINDSLVSKLENDKKKQLLKNKKKKVAEKIVTSKGKLIENKDAKLTEGKKELEKSKLIVNDSLVSKLENDKKKQCHKKDSVK
ncbi:MAG: hypothetical protein L3J23_07625 [Flavobacteriaceae bacterium]|nr:hypothetical protein [Flavobacteriaceae bacterium]